MTEFSREWLNRAEDNLSSAGFLLNKWPVPMEIICFLCQQCAEMSLKGVLAEYDIEPPKTHNLERLCEMCSNLDGRFAEWNEICKRLAPYASSSRYPNGPEVTKEKMNYALEKSRQIFNFVQSVLEEGAIEGPEDA